MCLRLARLAIALAVLWSARAESAECPLDEGLSFLATAKPRASKIEKGEVAWNASNGGPYYDPVQEFIDSWEHTAASEYFVSFAKEVTKALIEKIPVIGKIASLVLGVFFGASKDFSWVRPLVTMIQEWTKKFVDQRIFDLVQSDTLGLLMTGNQSLIIYEKLSQAMKENASAGLPINKIYAHDRYEDLRTTAGLGRYCMNNLVTKKKVVGDNYGRLLPLFLLCANFRMSTLGENIKLAQFLEEQWGYRPSWAVVTAKTIKDVYDLVDERMTDFLQSWDKWRRNLIGAYSDRYQPGIQDWRHNDFYLTDRYWSDERDNNLWSFATYKKIFPDKEEQKLLKIMKERHWQSVQIKEKIPMLRPYATLHRLIPGNEKSTSRPQHMPEEITLGPLSAYSTSFYGRWSPMVYETHSKCKFRYPFVSLSWILREEVKNSKLKKIQASSGKWLDQLIFTSAWESETVTFKLPEESTGGTQGEKTSVGTRCGFSVLYSADSRNYNVGYMAELLLFRPDNTSSVWSGEAARELKPRQRLDWRWGKYSTGSGLCGFYWLWQVKRFATDDCKSACRDQTGNAIEFTFRWKPEW